MNNKKDSQIIKAIGIIWVILLVLWIIMFSVSGEHKYGDTSSSAKAAHKCCICGTTEGTTQITAKTKSGWDDNWYCKKHYADAWQYYYGN